MAIVAFLCSCLCIFLGWLWFAHTSSVKEVKQWQAESWMGPDLDLPEERPARILSLTDLPSLATSPTEGDFQAAINKSRAAGCRGAVISTGWATLTTGRRNEFSLDELKRAVELQNGRFLFLGIQVINTTVRDLPGDIAGLRFSDPQVIQRFKELLDCLAPLMKQRVILLSIGNEVDIYFGLHPDERSDFHQFLLECRQHVKALAPNVMVGTTMTDAAILDPDTLKVADRMDAYFLTYYHGQHGLEGKFKDATTSKSDIVQLVKKLSDRPVVFQEIGFPADPELASAEAQRVFVEGVFKAWDEVGDQIMMLNYFLLYDFPPEFVRQQIKYYGVEGDGGHLTQFLGSLGLHDSNGNPRPAWKAFQDRGRALNAR